MNLLLLSAEESGGDCVPLLLERIGKRGSWDE